MRQEVFVRRQPHVVDAGVAQFVSDRIGIDPRTASVRDERFAGLGFFRAEQSAADATTLPPSS